MQILASIFINSGYERVLQTMHNVQSNEKGWTGNADCVKMGNSGHPKSLLNGAYHEK
jgi:hypothetical protein